MKTRTPRSGSSSPLGLWRRHGPRFGAAGTVLALAVGVALSAGTGDPATGGPVPDEAAFKLVSGGDRWAPPVEISTPTTRDARGLEIDANGLGDFVAAWVVDGDDDIAAVIKRPGSAPGAPQVFAGDYDDPDVAIGGDGVGVLAFESTSTNANGFTESVYAASKAGSATSFSTATPFTGDGHNTFEASAQDPVVAVNGQGTGMLFFERDYYIPPSYSQLAEAVEGRILLNPSTNTWNAGVDLHTNPREPRNTEVSVAADGSVLFASNGFELGPCYYIHTMVMENDGTGSGVDPIAYTCGGAYNGIYPSNDRLPNGDVVMAYHHHTGAGVYALDIPKGRAMGSGDELEDQEVRLDNPDGSEDGLSPRVHTDAAGNAVVVWYDNSGTKSMLARFRPAGQSTWGPVEVISSRETYQGDFDFDMDDAGHGYLVYERTEGADQQVVAAERTPGAAGTWSTPEVLSVGQGIVADPQVVAGAAGHAFAAWRANSGDEVYLATLTPPANDPGDPNEPGPGSGDSTAPAVTVKGVAKQSNHKRIRVTVRCDEACQVMVMPKGKAVIKKGPPGTPKKAKLKLKKTRANLVAGQEQRLTLKFTGAKTKKLVRKVLNSKRGRIKLKLVATATDAAGNTSRRVIKVVLR